MIVTTEKLQYDYFHWGCRTMKFVKEVLSFIVRFICLLPQTFGIKSWCKDHFEGFTLQGDYNPNLPPTKNVTVEDFHVLSQVDKVKAQRIYFFLTGALYYRIR